MMVFDARAGKKRPRPKDLPFELPRLHYVAPDGTLIYCIEYTTDEDGTWFMPCVKDGIYYTIYAQYRLRSHFIKWLNAHFPNSKEVLW